MGTVTTDYSGIPVPAGGQTLVSDALQLSEVNLLLVTITGIMLGYATDSETFFSKVRSIWAPQSQPAWEQGDDVCFVSAFLVDDPYDKLRNEQLVAVGDNFQSVTAYHRVWEFAFDHYGPNSFDNARIIRDAIFMDYFHGILGQGLYQNPGYGLFLTGELSAVIRAPEKFQGRYWERVHHSMRFNELVTSTVSPINSVVSVAVAVETAIDEVDFVVSQ